jgi:hypothetical protein
MRLWRIREKNKFCSRFFRDIKNWQKIDIPKMAESFMAPNFVFDFEGGIHSGRHTQNILKILLKYHWNVYKYLKKYLKKFENI